MDTNKQIDTIEKTLHNHIPVPQGVHIQNSVMVLLFPIDGELHILYTQRAFSLKKQPGDICFPGGKKEGNETPLETALRETQEELGISKNVIHVLGQTDYIITHHGSIIYPFVGYVDAISVKDIVFNKTEVAKLFTVPLRFFSQAQPLTHYIYFKPELPEDFPYELIMGGRNYPFTTPKIAELFYEYDGNIIWGMTARITKHVFQLLSDCIC